MFLLFEGCVTVWLRLRERQDARGRAEPGAPTRGKRSGKAELQNFYKVPGRAQRGPEGRALLQRGASTREFFSRFSRAPEAWKLVAKAEEAMAAEGLSAKPKSWLLQQRVNLRTLKHSHRARAAPRSRPPSPASSTHAATCRTPSLGRRP